MIIKNVQLNNFRNYENISINLKSNLNVFVGDNAQGKTNFLEAIYTGCTGRSFRTWDDKDLIKMDAQMSRIHVETLEGKNSQSIDTTLLYTKSKEIRINKVPIKKYSELIGRSYLVIFSPDDLRLVKEGPQERRRFLDREISLLSSTYYYNLVQYNKLLKQRNKLLKDISFNKAKADTLDPWDIQLCQYGSKIILKRYAFIEELKNHSNTLHYQISDGKEKLSVEYLSNPGVTESYNYDTIISCMTEKLTKKRESDLQRGTTSVGPHRDDFNLKVNGLSLKDYGSQGQHRSAALSLKLSEIEIIKLQTERNPVVLLDDVMSELDPSRQNQLLSCLDHLQIIMTVTDIANLANSALEGACLYHVHQGVIETEMITGGAKE